MAQNEANDRQAAVECYTSAVLPQLKRLLGSLDREPASLTFGSFDRDHWAWKFRDFPLGMLQAAAYPLALAWRHPFADNPYAGNEQLLHWIDAALLATIARQHRNGAFDGFSPNEQNPGPTLGIAHGMAEAYRLVQTALPADRRAQITNSVARACEFALTREEDHGFVSNHWALFAVAFHDAFELTGRQEFARRAEATMARILEQQSQDGWYNEYGGPDPGYESLGIFHMAVYWSRTKDARVLDSLRRSVEFYSHCVHPDGSVGGSYGSRHTGLYFPGGFEILAPVLPRAAAVALFMRCELARGNVPTPANVDLENLPPLAYTYVEAAAAASVEGIRDSDALPSEEFNGSRTFARCGLTVVGTRSYYALVQGGKGGVCRVFDRRLRRIAYEDAGYLLRTADNLWTSQLDGTAQPADDKEQVVAATRFTEVKQELVTPGRFVVLRLLNLTLFRSLTLGNWLRRMIVRRLITARNVGPFTLKRRVRFTADEIVFEDELSADQRVNVLDVQLPRAFSSIHMGSAKYFHTSELETIPSPDLAGVAEELTRTQHASRAFVLRFGLSGVELAGAHAQPEMLREAVSEARPFQAR